jgi:hypothetical protein
MSAKHLNQAAARCGCGAWPCIHKRQAGHHHFVYQISCTKCGVATAKSDDFNEVLGEWNEGVVTPAANNIERRTSNIEHRTGN